MFGHGKSAALAQAILVSQFVACGGDSYQESRTQSILPQHQEDFEILALSAASDDFYCPPGSQFHSDLQLCSNGTEALGPFPQAMIDKCVAYGGGQACQNSNWSLNFAGALRGQGVCPHGSSRNSSGLCLGNGFAYGPFSKSHVQACSDAGGGEICNTLRWDQEFAQATLPEPPQQLDQFTFPFTGPAAADYTQAPRNFGSCRSGCSRRHAASDLYGPIGRPIYAVGDGKVLDFHYFYDGTYALVVDHDEFVVRYGEIKGTLPSGVQVGAQVKRGQRIAYVGDLVSLNYQMLHFERFSGAASGPLTVRSNPPYQRRWDLQNPEADLIKWRYPR